MNNVLGKVIVRVRYKNDLSVSILTEFSKEYTTFSDPRQHIIEQNRNGDCIFMRMYMQSER